MTFRGNPPAYSGGDFPADRPRSVGDVRDNLVEPHDDLP